MYRVTLHLPEALNDGSPVPPEQFALYEDELLEIVALARVSSGSGEEGFILSHVIGGWRSPSNKKYREPFRLYAIDVADAQTVLDRVVRLAHLIRVDLVEEAVYLTVSPIDATTVTEYVAA